MPFFLKKVGGALIRVGALNRDYTVFNFGFFHPILIRFGLGANFGLKRTWNKFEITKALCLLKADLRRALCRPKAGPRTALFSRIYIHISLFIQPYTQEVLQKIYILRVLKSA